MEHEGKPYFIGKEVAEKLGYSNTAKAISTHCKRAEILPSQNGILESASNRGTQIIPEADLYRLVIKSELLSRFATADSCPVKLTGWEMQNLKSKA
ncbi:BRO-N domain-containing protein [Vibrio agarivorans]|uniref:BRO-N domain-containing protein n=1 Tax=Vibrio agarivorans TaxID=153622 RepID=UPI00338E7501